MTFDRGVIGDSWIEVICPTKEMSLIFTKQEDGSLKFDHTVPPMVDVDDYVDDARRFAEAEIANGWKMAG